MRNDYILVKVKYSFPHPRDIRQRGPAFLAVDSRNKVVPVDLVLDPALDPSGDILFLERCRIRPIRDCPGIDRDPHRRVEHRAVTHVSPREVNCAQRHQHDRDDPPHASAEHFDYPRQAEA